ncbi:group I truncated hemoglobin [Photobacterium atrarenae]|uniref:Group 1 truncated hemoglobin n=1 Tax=Photobacterium atrarenae TaxID=865757 RepID=A0ABY5GHC8_9GAMM|nr:group 1 truncated hemoglobin [Photobacterium atrarenae]UTV28529.1 group 1 truncated hemoglobin [Photobacterium atrarenae]
MSVQRKCSLKCLCFLSLMVLAVTAVAEEGKDKSLYDRLGGLAAIAVVVDDFIDVLVVDETLNANPAVDAARKVVPAPYLKYHVTAMVCQATDGPCTYTGRTMEKAHHHLNITLEEWQRMVQLLRGTLNKFEVPAAEQEALLEIVYSTKADIVQSGNGEQSGSAAAE